MLGGIGIVIDPLAIAFTVAKASGAADTSLLACHPLDKIKGANAA